MTKSMCNPVVLNPNGKIVTILLEGIVIEKFDDSRKMLDLWQCFFVFPISNAISTDLY